MTLDEALTYYANQLIIQYNSLPKASQTIECLVNNAVCDGLIFQLEDAFNLDTAAGQQLTILGKIVDVPRLIFGLDLGHEFFNFTRYAGIPASNGFNRWTTPNDTMLLSRWRTDTSYTATDFELLALIKLKIMYNNYYTSLGTIKAALYDVFAGDIDIVDNLDFTITYNFKQPYYNVATICTFLGNILPKPMGVGITVVQV